LGLFKNFYKYDFPVEVMKRLFKFRYPKIALLVVFSILTYFIFKNVDTHQFVVLLGDFGFLSYFVAGMLFSFGFTTPFAIGFFVTAHPESIFLMALIGGLGALISDLSIFKLIKFSFIDEFNRLDRTHPAKILHEEMHRNIPKRIRNYLMFGVAGLVLASPLPDELGVAMLAGLGHIKPIPFILISFIMNSFGILVMLLI